IVSSGPKLEKYNIQG
ncbi:MAG: hypothetical protein EZS28_046351, partial [Streblomastix strix]